MDIHTDIYDEFSCIGNNCKRNCCQGWTINIDPETTRFYKSLDDDFGRYIQSKLEDTEDGGSRFRLSKGEKCPAQTDTGLCNIFVQYGENRLSNTCTMFPRYHIGTYGDNRFRYLSNECEEVIRLLYDKESKLDVVIEAEDNNDLKNNSTMLDFAQVIAWCVDFIQDESVPLWNSLITSMHIAIEAISYFLKNDMDGFQRTIDSIPIIIEAYNKAVGGLPDESLKEIAWGNAKLISVAYLDRLYMTDFVALSDMLPCNEKYRSESPDRGDQLKKSFERFSSKIKKRDVTFFRRFFANMMNAYSFELLKEHSKEVFLYEFAPRVIISLMVPSLWKDEDLTDRNEYFYKLAMLQRMSKREFMSGLEGAFKDQMKIDLTLYAVVFAGLFGRND